MGSTRRPHEMRPHLPGYERPKLTAVFASVQGPPRRQSLLHVAEATSHAIRQALRISARLFGTHLHTRPSRIASRTVRQMHLRRHILKCFLHNVLQLVLVGGSSISDVQSPRTLYVMAHVAGLVKQQSGWRGGVVPPQRLATTALWEQVPCSCSPLADRKTRERRAANKRDLIAGISGFWVKIAVCEKSCDGTAAILGCGKDPVRGFTVHWVGLYRYWRALSNSIAANKRLGLQPLKQACLLNESLVTQGTDERGYHNPFAL